MARELLSSTLISSEIMSKKEKIELAHDQKCAMARFVEFTNGRGKIFILKGYAGTGKTTMVKEMIKLLKEKNEKYRLLASTGRAAKILHDKTGEETSTVHSCIYKYSDFNQDLDKVVDERERNKGVDSTGQLLLNFTLSVLEDNNITTYYIIDEASMISDDEDKAAYQAAFGSGRLLYDLLEHDPNGKYIFIGDVCQLPPISQKESPALSVDYFRRTFGQDAVEVTLTEIKRQETGNDIVVAAQKLRRLYEHPQTWVWAKFPMKGFQNIHLLYSQAELVQKYIDRVRKYGYTDSTLICFSNKLCDTLTRIIRPALGFTSPQLQKGDLLLVTQNNYISGLMNGDQVVVDSVQVKEKRAGLTFLEISFHEVLTGKEYSQLMIADILYANQTNLSSAQQKELFVEFFIRMKKKGIKQKSEMFNKMMMCDPYLNALRAVFGFALTCHKVQGGEWDNVFLDIPRSFPRREKPYVYQWVYTAMTRARKELYSVNDFYIM